MTTRELFYTAYSAARMAERDQAALWAAPSPMAAALDATREFSGPERFRVAAYAERLTNMPRSYRLRRMTVDRTPVRLKREMRQIGHHINRVANWIAAQEVL